MPPDGVAAAAQALLALDARGARALNALVRRSKRGQQAAGLAAGGLANAEIGCMLLLAVRGDIRTALRMLCAVATVYAVCEVLGYAWPRERPFAGSAEIQELLAHHPSRSFPSRHVASALAMARVAQGGHPGTGRTMTGLAWVLGLSRVAAGLHFPTDVLMGAALGAVVGYVWRA